MLFQRIEIIISKTQKLINMKLSKILLSLLLVSLVLLSTSCDKENVDNRPDLPPAESMLMDFDDFQSNPTPGIAPGTKGIVYTYDNFVHAYTNIAFWNAFTTVTLILPVSSYAYALQQDPVYTGDDTWEWKYSFNIMQLNYTATLTGKRLGNETFSMEMNISSTSIPGVKFKYFDGVCRYDHTHAEWNLYKNVEGSTIKVLEVEWDKDFETEDASMKYTYVEQGMDETGSFIFWEYDADGTPYDASYTIDLSAGVINVEWDTDTKAGRVMNPVFFEDSNWHCWNEELEDTECDI